MYANGDGIVNCFCCSVEDPSWGGCFALFSFCGTFRASLYNTPESLLQNLVHFFVQDYVDIRNRYYSAALFLRNFFCKVYSQFVSTLPCDPRRLIV